ncbi:MAG: DUF2157 domain-containing protein, partial [Pseudomonadota bacterium]
MKPHADWLLRELPRLVETGVLDEAAAGRLRAHYAAAAAQAGWGRVLFPVLGALLVGLGVILLVAHNWDGYTRTQRLVAAFLPLLAGQFACLWTLLKASGSVAWRESTALFTGLAFAAALALVGQIFHFPGDLDRYLLACGLVALPLVYLLDASLLAVLCAAAFAGWSFAYPRADPSVFAVLALFALLAPQLWRMQRRDAAGLRTALLTAALVPLFFAAVYAALPAISRLGLWWLAELGGLRVMIEALRPGAAPLWRRPLAIYGALGTALAALIGSFPDVWRNWHWATEPTALPQAWLLLGAGLAVLAVLAWRAWRARQRLAAMQALPAFAMAVVAPLESQPLAVALALLFTAYVLVLGLALVRDGMARRDSGAATRGLFLIALLVLLRFIDSDWSFTARGVAFVLVGAAFIAASLWLRRRVS